LNAKVFRYGSGATAQGDETAGVLNRGLSGFLNRYSQTAVEEDKAEVFSVMIVQSEHIAERVRSDQVLDSKTRMMRDIIKGYCAAMDDSFWERARKLQRSVPANR
jgi:hypothetical protein